MLIIISYWKFSFIITTVHKLKKLKIVSMNEHNLTELLLCFCALHKLYKLESELSFVQSPKNLNQW